MLSRGCLGRGASRGDGLRNERKTSPPPNPANMERFCLPHPPRRCGKLQFSGVRGAYKECKCTRSNIGTCLRKSRIVDDTQQQAYGQSCTRAPTACLELSSSHVCFATRRSADLWGVKGRVGVLFFLPYASSKEACVSLKKQSKTRTQPPAPHVRATGSVFPERLTVCCWQRSELEMDWTCTP